MRRLNYLGYFCSIVTLVLFSSRAYSQQQNIPLNTAFSFEIDKEIIISDSIQHVGFLPLLQSRIKSIEAENYVPNLQFNTKSKKSFDSRKLFHEHIIQYKEGEVQFTIDPLVNFEFGQEQSDYKRDQALYKNMRGFLLRVNLGSKVSAASSFRENQVELPTYLSNKTDSSGVAFGQGRVKSFNKTGFDFAMASSNISYSPNEKINIQVGHGKHFVGYGYRSFLLSDLAFNYPYLKLNTLWFKGKLQYQNLYTSFQDLVRINTSIESEGLFERKQGAFHYIDYAINSKFNIGLFEGLVLQSLDSTGNISIPINYWVPLIFLNTLIEEDPAKGNSLVGMNSNYKLKKNWQVYGQLTNYGFKNMKPSFQIGSKYYLHVLPIRIQLEYNSRAKNSRTNLFNHYNESLNANLFSEQKELIGSMLYKKGRILTQLLGSVINGNQQKSTFVDVRQSYIVNPAYNLTFSAGIQHREWENNLGPENYFYIGLSTNLQNLYFDQ